MSLLGYPLQVIRTNGAYDENGIWAEAFSVEETIIGSAQPVSGYEFQDLPEGRKQFGAIKVYTTAILKAADVINPSRGDIVIFDGVKWEVAQKLPYASGIIPHNKYLAYVLETENA